MDPSPLALKLCPFILCVTFALCAQNSDATKPEEPGSIEGVVLSDSTGQPLRRAQVALHPAESGSGGSLQTTNETGVFSFPKVAPGRYTITVQRDGYLPLSAARIGLFKMPPIFSVSRARVIRSFSFASRLRAS